MSEKLAIILVSGDPDVIEMGLEYAKNAVRHAWVPNIRVYLFGPAEISIATHPALGRQVRALIEMGVIPEACIWCSDRHNVTQLLEELGCIVRGIGQPVSQAILAGYTPMTW